MTADHERARALTIEPLALHLDLVDHIAQWHWKEWGDAPYARPETEWRASLRGRATDGGIPYTLVAFLGDTPVGSVSVCLDDADPEFLEHGPWLSGVLVRPPARNLGVGRELLLEIERHSRACGATELWLHTGEAQRFYVRCGWSVVRAKTEPGDADAVMCRTL